MDIQLFDSVEDMQCFLSKELKRIKSSNKFTVAISGGSILSVLSTPLFYAAKEVDYSGWCVIAADERVADPDSELSNQNAILNHLAGKESKISNFIMPDISVDLEPHKAALDYERKLYAHNICSVSLAILGVGEDGHICSLFPYKMMPDDSCFYIGISDSPKFPPKRISLSMDALCKAENVIIIVTGNKKKEIMHRIMAKKELPELPVEILCSRRPVKWLVEKEALA